MMEELVKKIIDLTEELTILKGVIQNAEKGVIQARKKS